MACHTPPLKKSKETKENAITTLLYLTNQDTVFAGYISCGLPRMHTVSDCMLEKRMASLFD